MWQKNKYFKRALLVQRVNIDKTVKNYTDLLLYIEKQEIELQIYPNTLDLINERLPVFKKNLPILKDNLESLKDLINNEKDKDTLLDLKNQMSERRYNISEIENFIYEAPARITELKKAIEQNTNWLDAVKGIEQQMKVERAKDLNKGKDVF